MRAAARKAVWEEGTVFMRHTDKDGNITYQAHRCWNVTEFSRNAARNAAEVGGCSKAERVDEATYLRWVKLNRRHR